MQFYNWFHASIDRLPKPEVSESFAGAMRLMNMSSTTSNDLMSRYLNDKNITVASIGVSFTGVLREVSPFSFSMIYKTFLKLSSTLERRKFDPL